MDKREGAIDYILSQLELGYIEVFGWNDSSKLEILKEAVNRHLIPMKVIKELDEDIGEYWCSCPNCGCGFGWRRNKHNAFCGDCGQRLNWK